MIPPLEQIGDGYNELEKLQTLQEHYKFYQKQPVVQQVTRVDSMKEVAQELLQSELHQDEIDAIKDIILQLSEEHQLLEHKLQVKFDKKHSEVELLTQNMILLEKLQNLYEDKLALKKKNHNQLQIISSLMQRIYTLNNDLTKQMNDLTKYNSQIPNEREVELTKQNYALRQELDQMKSIYQQIDHIQGILAQAEQTRQIVIDQLRNIQKY